MPAWCSWFYHCFIIMWSELLVDVNLCRTLSLVQLRCLILHQGSWSSVLCSLSCYNLPWTCRMLMLLGRSLSISFLPVPWDLTWTFVIFQCLVKLEFELNFCLLRFLNLHFFPRVFLFWFWPPLMHLTSVGDFLSLIAGIVRAVGAVLGSTDHALANVGGLKSLSPTCVVILAHNSCKCFLCHQCKYSFMQTAYLPVPTWSA